jgi:putative membrane protein
LFQWRNIFKGMAMGVSDLIPGVSGGTIALLLGIYQQFIASINGVFSKRWKQSVLFLIPIGIGIVLALLLVSRLVEWLIEAYPQPTFIFFLGLIIGIIPTLLKEIDYKKSFTPVHYVLLLIGAVLVASTAFVKDDNMTAVIEHLGQSDYILLFFAGWLASSAMILPGISGSFVLLLLGVYPTVINAVSNLNFAVILTVGAGVLIGVLVTSKLITILLAKFKAGTYAVMIGFIVGSIVIIYPGLPGNAVLIIVSIIAFIAGVISAYTLSGLDVEK